MAVHRNRVIYQSEALFISPDATGAHQTGANISDLAGTDALPTGADNQIIDPYWSGVNADVGPGPFGLFTPPTSNIQIFGTGSGAATDPDSASGVYKNNRGNLVGWTCGDDWPAWNTAGAHETGKNLSGASQYHGTIIQQLKRVQTANYGFTVNRQDVNEFGHLARLDSIVVESPTVNLDFSYYLLDGFNERQLEFVTDGITNTMSGALSPELYQAGNNFFILTVPESRDAVGGDVAPDLTGTAADNDKKSVISLGNGYVTDYSVDISVGAIPTASVTVEGMNIKADPGETGLDVPGMDMADGSLISDAWRSGRGVCAGANGCTGLFSLPAASSGYDGCDGGVYAALRPGDVTLDLKNQALLSKQVSGNANTPLQGSAHVQSVSISLPMGRTTLQRLGSTFGFSKALDVPMTATMSVSALMSDVKEGRLSDLICSCEEYVLTVKLYDPECADCVTKDAGLAMMYIFKGAKLESENYTSTIGDNKTVDLTFTTQIGSSDDPSNGVYISGKEANAATCDVMGVPPGWTGLNGENNAPVSGFMVGYRK
tara:strand:+ start:3276 stop:4910 length:1635 start_codon:yes stop_codon:yes gene_type:complete